MDRPIIYNREILVSVLVYHYPNDNRSCGCGWAELGKSHPEHVATIYEESIRAKVSDLIPGGWCEEDGCPVNICDGPHYKHACLMGTIMIGTAGPCQFCGWVLTNDS